MTLTHNKARLAIQCKASTGETGTFLFVPCSDLEPISPVLPGLVPLLDWCREHGWYSAPGSDPVGVYRRDL